MQLALGLVPIVAIPGCTCPTPPDGEHTLDELTTRRDLIQQGALMRQAGCATQTGGTTGGSSGLGELPNYGGAGGLGGASSFAGAQGLGGDLGSAGAPGFAGAGGTGGPNGMGQGGAGPESPAVCDFTFPGWVTRDWRSWYENGIATALSWNPASGCPTTTQYNALMYTLEYTEAEAIELLESADGVCVYEQVVYCPGGRPFLIQGQARVAALRGKAPRPHATTTTRQAIAAAWSSDALAEHASIAAFARLSLQLLAHGAPLELVTLSQRASLDEARHADLCLREARRHAGTRLEWGPLPLSDAKLAVSEEELLITNVLEGCIGETLAAAHARARADCAGSKRLRAALLRLAADEERHATLAWSILRWQLERSPALRAVVLSTFAEFRPPVRVSNPVEADARWAKAGLLGASAMRAIDRAVWHSVIVPLVARFLQPVDARSSVPVPTNTAIAS